MISLLDKKKALELLGYDCDTSDGEITAWRDERAQPATWEEILSLAEDRRLEIEVERRAAVKVSPRQIRLALLGYGITPAMVETALVGNPAAMIEWEYALEIARNHPLIPAMGEALGFSNDQIDAVFAAAAAIE